jgi:hypothetical protein
MSEMAVQSLQLISNGCKRTLRNSVVFAEILDNLAAVLGDLTHDAVIGVVGALAPVIDSNIREAVKVEPFAKLMLPFNSQWAGRAATPELVLEISFVLDCHAAVATGTPMVYCSHLAFAEKGGFYRELLQIYRTYSGALGGGLPGEEVHRIQTARVSILNLLLNWIRKVPQFGEEGKVLVATVLGTIVQEYGTASPNSRLPDVLLVVEGFCTRLSSVMMPEMPSLFAVILEQTICLIGEDFEQSMDFRVPFFDFLVLMIDKYFAILPVARQHYSVP